ncbi:MAG: pitrilysin family protein [Candidatus Paceibacterota bacterium]|jgi:predicted Zn-dependent peptidase
MKYIKKVLKNGLRVIVVPMKDNPTVTVLAMVETGSKYESKEINGLSHFLEHMTFKGTTKRPSAFVITKELDGIGARYNAFTGEEYTGYYAKADKKHFGKILDVVSDMYLNPIFPEKEIEKEKGVIKEEINMYEDLPQQSIGWEFMKLLYGDTPAGRSVLGLKENIDRMSRHHFIDYRKAHYVAEATMVVVSGNIKTTNAIKGVEKAFQSITTSSKSGKEKVVESQTAPRIALKYKDTDQTHIVLGLRTFDTYNKKKTIMSVLRAVISGGMSSRLFQKLRDEMGVCYYVHASHDTFTDHGYFAIAAGVDTARIKEVIQVLLSELRRLTVELVPKEELDRTKDFLAGGMYLGLESSDDLADFYGNQEILRKKIKEPKQIESEVRKVTAKQIRDLAKEIFVDERLNLAIIGRFKDEKEFLDVLKF